jgi:arylsulfatase A-like enzyme
MAREELEPKRRLLWWFLQRKAISPTGTAKTALTMATERRQIPLDVLVLSAWCGLAGGLLEVGTRVVCKILPGQRMYMMSRHFVWMAPLSNLLLFAAFGLVLAFATKLWPVRAGWLCSRLICSLAILPSIIVVSPGIYPWASAILAIGISARLMPILESRQAQARRWLLRSFPALVGVVLVLGGYLLGGDWLKVRREEGRPLPPGDPPNVLLIVLDTVRADRLSLYGYHRPTSPTLEALAKRGIRFDAARATAPWTLPSHASMFTGRWPHELDVNWRTALGTKYPTLAEYLGSRGYATTGFVANVEYCSSEFGLDRGFTHYEDYVLEALSAVRMSYLGDLALKGVSHLGWMLSSNLGAISFLPDKDSTVWPVLASNSRIDARSINREFLDWLSRRRQPTRPFFAFLNYFDAHSGYMLPPGTPYRFGRPPKTDADVQVLVDWFSIDKLKLPPSYLTLARNCYDSCIGYLDEQLGELFGELKRRGVLDRTLVIVTSDHGEGLGEHDLFFHGESLYRPEIHVPLLIALPGQTKSAIVNETVSLRDLPATIAELIGQGSGSPFPGRSLARLWRDSRPADASQAGEGAISELASPNPFDPNQGRSPVHRGALVSLAEGDYVYIRNEGDGGEELFNWRDDPNEFDNRARFTAVQAVMEGMRARLNHMRAGHPDAAR